MTDEKNLKNLSPQDLEKASGGWTHHDEPVTFTVFVCPSCAYRDFWDGDYSEKTDYDPPKCYHCGTEMVIFAVKTEYWH